MRVARCSQVDRNSEQIALPPRPPTTDAKWKLKQREAGAPTLVAMGVSELQICADGVQVRVSHESNRRKSPMFTCREGHTPAASVQSRAFRGGRWRVFSTGLERGPALTQFGSNSVASLRNHRSAPMPSTPITRQCTRPRRRLDLNCRQCAQSTLSIVLTQDPLESEPAINVVLLEEDERIRYL